MIIGEWLTLIGNVIPECKVKITINDVETPLRPSALNREYRWNRMMCQMEVPSRWRT